MADLFDAAAEAVAIATGVPKSQAAAELKGAPREAVPPEDGLVGWDAPHADDLDAETEEVEAIQRDLGEPTLDDDESHEGESKVAHCKTCERALLKVTRRNARRRRA